MKLIGLTGKARAGKDTIANHLWLDHLYVKLSFAHPLKTAVGTIFGLTREQTWEDELKEVVVPYWGLTPRQMLQKMGTEAIRNTFGGDVWVKRLALSYDAVRNTDNVVISDVRFHEEAQYIRSQGGVIVEVVRNTAGLDGVEAGHVSESGIGSPADFTVENNSTKEALYGEIDLLVSKL